LDRANLLLNIFIFHIIKQASASYWSKTERM